MVTATQVLDRFGDLSDRLRGDDLQRALRRALMTQAMAVHGGGEIEVAEANADWFLKMLVSGMTIVEAYRVEGEMTGLIESAALTLDDDDQFDRTLAPSPAGFVMFEQPIRIGTWGSGKPLEVQYLIWCPGPNPDGVRRTALYWFDDPTRPGAGPGGDVQYEGLGSRWEMIGWTSIRQGQSLGEPTVVVESNVDSDGVVTADGLHVYSDEQANDIRLIWALWLLLGQTIVQTEKERPDRAGLRRAERLKLKPFVTVVRLRKTTSESHEHSEVEWAHRWLVRGHWAWRKCGPDLHGAVPYEKGHRRRIWIDGYVKGPDGAPLRMTRKVYSLER